MDVSGGKVVLPTCENGHRERATSHKRRPMKRIDERMGKEENFRGDGRVRAGGGAGGFNEAKSRPVSELVSQSVGAGFFR